ncbi:MAG: hypothetical protein LBI67_12085 [Treponema sp.]|nr:hypothetical protein [Treponema sp.]
MCGVRRVLVLYLAVQLSVPLFAQSDGSPAFPVELQQPRYGEAPRFPADYWIGELGRGEAGEEAYQFARRAAGRLADGNGEDLPEHAKQLLQSLADMEIRNARIGGGRTEADGSVSFMVRFLGREAVVTGEMFLRRSNQVSGENAEMSAWYLDDLILDQRRPLNEGRFGPGSTDMTPYERFF